MGLQQAKAILEMGTSLSFCSVIRNRYHPLFSPTVYYGFNGTGFPGGFSSFFKRDFLFALLTTKHLLKRGETEKKNASKGNKSIPSKVGRQNNFDRVASTESVSIRYKLAMKSLNQIDLDFPFFPYIRAVLARYIIFNSSHIQEGMLGSSDSYKRH